MSDTSSWESPALLAAIVAAGAAWLSYRKLKLDLFDKRYSVYREINVQTMARLREIGAAKPPNMPLDEAMKAFSAAGQQVEFLFGPKAEQACRVLDAALSEYLMAWTAVRFADSPAERALASPRFTDAHLAVPKALGAFNSVCAPALRQYSPLWHAAKAGTQRAHHRLKAQFRKFWP